MMLRSASPAGRSIAAAVFAGVLTMLAGCSGSSGGSDGSATPSPSATTATPTPSPSPSASATPAVIDYAHGDPGGGFVIMRDSDIENLAGAPVDFKTYLHKQLAKFDKEDGADSQCHSTILIIKLDPQGFAAGAISDCGGAEVYWAKVNGAWTQAFGTQEEAPRCRDLRKYGFPTSVGGTSCLDDADKKVPYAG